MSATRFQISNFKSQDRKPGISEELLLIVIAAVSIGVSAIIYLVTL